jgi:NADP-dependent 3-hydroxy acid dehydrogenase YdfG
MIAWNNNSIFMDFKIDAELCDLWNKRSIINTNEIITMQKVWLITGSSRGFGRSLAEAVLAKGDQLVATARKTEQLADLAERYSNQVRLVRLDVTQYDQAETASKLHSIRSADWTFL